MRKPAIQNVSGNFDVLMTPETQTEAPKGGVTTARFGLFKTFHGDLTGTAIGTMLSGGSPA